MLYQLASVPSTVYLDSKNLTDMDASQANIWILKSNFKPDDYGLLSGILEDAISSWSMEMTSLLGANKDLESEKDQGSYTSLLRKGARLIQGTIAMVDASDVENIVEDLFTAPSPCASTAPNTSQPTQRRRTLSEKSTGRIVTAAELGLHFRRATTVPYNSFLWKMLRHLVDVISPNSHISYPTSLMGFIKAVWADLMVQFDGCWERKEMIPLVDIFGELPDEPACGDYDDSGSQTKIAFIDFRYNLLHQKLTMVNCCIARELTRRQDDSSPSPPSSTPTSPSSIGSTSEKEVPVLPKEQSGSKRTSVSELVAPEDDTLMDATADNKTPDDSSGSSNCSSEDRQTPLAEALGVKDLSTGSDTLGTTKSTPPVVYQGKGGLKPYKDLKLLATGEPLMIPKLQVRKSHCCHFILCHVPPSSSFNFTGNLLTCLFFYMF
jgi:hypothetical protein